MHAGEFIGLARAQSLVWVQAPDALQQPLAAQHFMAAGNAALKVMRHVKQCAIAVGHLAVQRQQFGRYLPACNRLVCAREQLHGALRPHTPVAQQATLDAHGNGFAIAHERERRQEVQHDVVVIAGVKRHALFGLGGDHTANYIKRAVAVEWRHLDGHHVVDFAEAPPEINAKVNAAHGWLQVEPDQWHHLGHRAAMRDQRVVARTLHGGQAQQSCVVAHGLDGGGLGRGLGGFARQTGDHEQRAFAAQWRPALGRLHGKLKHPLV